MRPEEVSSLNLAFLGDAVWSLVVREKLVTSSDLPVGKQAEAAKNMVSAKAQAGFMHALIDGNLLTEVENDVYHRGRNTHGNSQARHTDPVTYRVATGFEAMIGYLYLSGNVERIQEILDISWTKGD